MGGLCCSANEICRESKRQTINADDVLKAVEELDFPEFCEPLKATLAGFRKENDAKKQDSKRKEVARKRKAGDSNGTDGDIHVNGRLDEAVTMAEDEGFTD
jgi:DNA polymerase epsilon subunit 3